MSGMFFETQCIMKYLRFSHQTGGSWDADADRMVRVSQILHRDTFVM